MKAITGMRIIGASAVALVILGCASVTPHENFVNFLNRQVGKDPAWLKAHYQFPDEKDLVGTKELQNGNIEKKYQVTWGRGKRTCIRYYEIDPATNIIVRADFEGAEDVEKDCVINP